MFRHTPHSVKLRLPSASLAVSQAKRAPQYAAYVPEKRIVYAPWRAVGAVMHGDAIPGARLTSRELVLGQARAGMCPSADERLSFQPAWGGRSRDENEMGKATLENGCLPAQWLHAKRALVHGCTQLTLRRRQLESPMNKMFLKGRPGCDGESERLLPSQLDGPGSIPSGIAPPDSRMRESCQAMQLVGGFSRGSPVSPVLAFRRCCILTSIPPHRLYTPAKWRHWTTRRRKTARQCAPGNRLPGSSENSKPFATCAVANHTKGPVPRASCSQSESGHVNGKEIATPPFSLCGYILCERAASLPLRYCHCRPKAAVFLLYFSPLPEDKEDRLQHSVHVTDIDQPVARVDSSSSTTVDDSDKDPNIELSSLESDYFDDVSSDEERVKNVASSSAPNTAQPDIIAEASTQRLGDSIGLESGVGFSIQPSLTKASSAPMSNTLIDISHGWKRLWNGEGGG
ncbi:hypothetical protein PR048_026995 [Dryococelus australis]|uniref:Uncharacterized protein n=1 Tax=Dryococelus australis TaxID=614101 RepID=A0ABQ9GMV6_9NEOP|nr:hypothetical protein PR048_026995 [Dryococelus australis]